MRNLRFRFDNLCGECARYCSSAAMSPETSSSYTKENLINQIVSSDSKTSFRTSKTIFRTSVGLKQRDKRLNSTPPFDTRIFLLRHKYQNPLYGN